LLDAYGGAGWAGTVLCQSRDGTWAPLRKMRGGPSRTFGSADVTIAFLDVHYKGFGARAACVLSQSWESESPIQTYTQDIETVEPYEPGKFFRRELPCLLAVLRRLPSLPEVIVVDGYVWLSSVRRPGLGAYLYEALGRSTAVVGIAKTAFRQGKSCGAVARVYRNSSRTPLFVTAAGMELEVASQHVRQMAGRHRIPELLRRADQLSRGATTVGVGAR